ncbi:MAG TPA: S8 family peptidase [Bryobacteraceae bacterium]|nr:S8 family peptidase [Bryobacteraceae bacterium]
MPTKLKEAASARRSMIITFKPKDQRLERKKDKVEIVQELISSEVQFVKSAEVQTFGMGPQSGVDRETLGYDVNLYEAPIVTASLTDAEITKVRSNANVLAVEEDGMCYALPEALVFEGQPSVLAETVPIGITQVKAPPAWDASRGKAINVAILDTGIDATHPDLAANVKGAVSFVPGETPADGNGHGTHCAGTIAAPINGIGVVGVAPAASIYAVKILSNSGSGQWSWLIAGITWCMQNNMKILSMSLGGSSAPAALETICNAAFDKGLLLVAAAGNAGAPVPPATSSVTYPGKYKKVIAVSAIDNANVIASFSSRGPEVELCAPGVNVLSCAPGGGYATKSGTSMACPHVSGGAAVVWGAHRFATNVQIFDLLTATADNLGVPGWDPLYGYGRLDVDQAAVMLAPAPAMGMKEISIAA